MIDEEKVKLMTKITIFEKNEELEDLAMVKFFKEDYVKYGCLKTIVATTLCYWMCIGIYILVNIEDVLNEINHMDYFKVIYSLMMGYMLVTVVFYIYAFIVYNVKYSLAKPRLVGYNRCLNKLIRLYENDEKAERMAKGKIRVYSTIGGGDDELTFEGQAEKTEKERPDDYYGDE